MIFNEVPLFRVPRVRVGKAFHEFLKSEKVTGGFSVNLIFVGVKKMTELNETWKGGKGPTDVLSFNYGEGDISGEIYICTKVAAKNARAEEVDVVGEILLLFVHGLLHLVGYTHETDRKYEIMMKKANGILEKI